MFSFFFLYTACSSEEALKTFNANPTISIDSHVDGAQIQEGYETLFWAQVGDSDHNHDELFVIWYFNQEDVCPETSPDVSGEFRTRIVAEDPEGARVVFPMTLQVTPGQSGAPAESE